jgi:hypothetical protein
MFIERETIRQVARRTHLAHCDETHIIEINTLRLLAGQKMHNAQQGIAARINTFRSILKTLGVADSLLEGGAATLERGPSGYQEVDMQKVYPVPKSWDYIKHLATGGRDRLCVLGQHLDDDVSHFCLEALARGFETFILVDLTSSRQESYANLLLQRLVFAGVMPTTSYQLIAEWGTSQLDSSLCAFILKQARLMG